MHTSAPRLGRSTTFTLKPDYEQTRQRIEAFWHHEVLDRPVVQFELLKPPEARVPLPSSHHPNPAARWMDAGYQAELASAQLANHEFLGDTLPVACANLGPDVFASLFGCPLEFGDYETSWSHPILTDWAHAADLKPDLESPYFQKLIEMTDALLAISDNRFITGMPDWHTGGDCLAALRGPETLATDLLDFPQEVKRLNERVTRHFFAVYEFFYRKLRAAGQPVSTWTPLVSEGRYYLPSNDFAGMISTPAYTEFFLQGIIEECRFLDRSMYHLDGPGAIRHLDVLLDIPELDAVQFVPPPGNETFSRWAAVYKRIQQAGKSLQVPCEIAEIDQVMQALEPKGLYLVVSGVPSCPAAEAMLAKLGRW